MQENLKGRTILVGKEPGGSRLFVSVRINGQPKTAPLNQFGGVPNSVSRCKASENVAHFKLDIAQNGTISITNMKPQNVTLVNGSEIVKKVIPENSTVELGKDRYAVSIPEVLDIASKIVKTVVKEPPKEYSIRHLQVVWANFHQGELDIRRRQKNIGLLRSASPLFTLGSGALATLARVMELGPQVFTVTLILTGIGLCIMAYSFYKGYTDKSIEEGEELRQDFQMRYVCPNPDCHHFVGQQPYNILRQNKSCPYCHCKWNEK